MRPLWHVLAGLLLAARPAASRRGAMETGTGPEGGGIGARERGFRGWGGVFGSGTPPRPPCCPPVVGLTGCESGWLGGTLHPARLGWDLRPCWGVSGAVRLLSVVFACWLGVGSVPKAHGVRAARWRGRGWCSSGQAMLGGWVVPALDVHTCADSRSARGSGTLHGTRRQGLRGCRARSCGALGPGISSASGPCIAAPTLCWDSKGCLYCGLLQADQNRTE